MLEAGVPFQVVAELMGWSSATTIRMVKRYGHIGRQSLRDAVNAIAAAASRIKRKPKQQTKTEVGSFDNPFDPGRGAESSPPNSNKKKAPQVGLEPTTLRLTAGCSAIELLRSNTHASNGASVTERG
jgi:hypothetical protein